MEHEIFIRYSRHDKDMVFPFVEQINKALGVECWIDLEGIESGEQFESVIIRAIDSCKVVLFILSDYSLNSKWTKREVHYAEHQNKRIIPVVIDGKGLRGWFIFHFGTVDYIDIHSHEQCDKLLGDLRGWIRTPNISQPKSYKLDNQLDFNRRFPQNLFSEDFHPIINMGIATQLATFVIILLMELWTLSSGCLAFYHHPQVSHIMLCLSTSVSLFATAQLHTRKSYWLGIISVADFVDIYLLGILGKYLYENWHVFSSLSSPTTMRYQLLYYLGKDMRIHNFMGLNTYLLLLVIGHIILMCLAFNFKKNGRSGWDLMS